MNIKAASLFALILCFLSGCSTKKQEPNTDNFFNTSINLYGFTLINESELLDPNLIALIDTFIIVGNYKGEPQLEIYGESGSLIKKTLSIGNGPSEVLTIGKIQADNNDEVFYVNDLFKRKILSYKMSELVNQSNYLPNVVYSLYNSGDSIITKELLVDKMLVGQNSLICESQSPLGRIALIDIQSGSFNYYIKFPPKELVDKDLTEVANADLYSSAIAVNPNGSKLAMATYSAGMLDLFRIGQENVSHYWNFNEFNPTGIELFSMGDVMVPVHSDKSRAGYLDVFATDDYVYALYSGKTLKEDNYQYGRIIKVISWETDESYTLHLDRLVKRIAISKDNSRIYGTSINSDGWPEVIVFELSSFD